MSDHLATPRPGTNIGCDNVAAIESRKRQSEQSQDNEDTTHPEPDWKKDKVRAVAGPNQQELDAVSLIASSMCINLTLSRNVFIASS